MRRKKGVVYVLEKLRSGVQRNEVIFTFFFYPFERSPNRRRRLFCLNWYTLCDIIIENAKNGFRKAFKEKYTASVKQSVLWASMSVLEGFLLGVCSL